MLFSLTRSSFIGFRFLKQDRLLDGAVGAANMHRLQHNLDMLNVSADHIVMGSEGEIFTYENSERIQSCIRLVLSSSSTHGDLSSIFVTLFSSVIACHCPTTGYAGGDIQVYWSRAERYAHTILSDLAAGSNGWVEWNLL